MNRFLKGLRSLDRVPEVFRCFRNVETPFAVTAAFVGFTPLAYPIDVRDRAGHTLRLYDFEDLTTLWAVWCADEYRISKDARVILDMGANIGAFCLFAMAHSPRARVIALEPFPSTFSKLKQVIAENGLADRIHCEQAAISATSGHLRMQADDSIKSHSRKAVADAAQDGAMIDVPSLSLADLMDKYALAHVDYLKVDIEGGEIPLFADVDDTTLRKVARIGVECHSAQGQQVVWARIKAAGFELERVSRVSFIGPASTAEFQRR